MPDFPELLTKRHLETPDCNKTAGPARESRPRRGAESADQKFAPSTESW